MATRAELYSRVLRILDTNSTSYPQTDFNSDLVESVALRTQQILRLQGYKHITQTHSYTDFISKTGLVAGNNGFNGEYALPTDLLDIERIEVKYDGSDDWYVISKEKGNLYDISQSTISEQDEDIIQDNYNESDPQATIVRGSMFIRPLNEDATVSNGIHIYYSPRQATIDEDTDIPEFESNFHQCLLYDCAEIEMIAHPNSYDQLKERRIAKKKSEVDKEFKNFYRTRIKSGETITTKKLNYN